MKTKNKIGRGIKFLIVMCLVYSLGTTVCTAQDCHGGYDPGSFYYCSSDCLCDAGEGHCQRDSECMPGLECVEDVGANYGYRNWIDVCEDPNPSTTTTTIQSTTTITETTTTQVELISSLTGVQATFFNSSFASPIKSKSFFNMKISRFQGIISTIGPTADQNIFQALN